MARPLLTLARMLVALVSFAGLFVAFTATFVLLGSGAVSTTRLTDLFLLDPILLFTATLFTATSTLNRLALWLVSVAVVITISPLLFLFLSGSAGWSGVTASALGFLALWAVLLLQQRKRLHTAPLPQDASLRS